MRGLGLSNRLWRFKSVRLNPPFLLMSLYAGLIVLGALLLKAPGAAYRPITWLEAFFTATSAVTVTGLTVVRTGEDFAPFGEAVILGLIQLGGLGIMTFAILVLSSLGFEVGIGHRILLREDLNRTSVRDLLKIVRAIFRVVVICEIAGAALLAFVFVPEFGWGHGLWSALFHSVSAFNNAGFALYADSLMRWSASPLVNLTVPVLFIIGGLGYAVLSDVLSGGPWRQYGLHTKLMLVGTAVLIAISVPLFALFEWHNPETLGGLGTAEKLWISWFHGLTPRTAGFNTIDVGDLRDPTALMTMSLMFIGGGSTSTAGGIKVTTAIVLLLATVAFFRRQHAPVAFGRSMRLEQLLKVLALTITGVLFVLTGVLLLTATHEIPFLDLTFEVVSAFGTVGLSRGATGELNALGQLVIMVIMFFGRVGPLTIGFFLATRTAPRIRYPEGQVFLG